MSSPAKTEKTKKFKHNKVLSVRVKHNETGDAVVLDFPMTSLDTKDIPEITVITVSRNRKAFFGLAIDNWSRMYYPYDKISWLVVDDSDSLELSPIKELKNLEDKRAMFYYLPPNKDDKGAVVPHSVGTKRNLAMSLVKTEYVVFMDDDDYLYDNSVLARVCALMFYKRECVYCSDLGVYSIHKKQSYVLEKFADVPEGTIACTKKFWEKQKFGENTSGCEGFNMVAGRERDMLQMPWFFVAVVLNHDTNITHNARNVRFGVSDEKLKEIAASGNHMDFYKDIFNDSFKRQLNILIDLQTKKE